MKWHLNRLIVHEEQTAIVAVPYFPRTTLTLRIYLVVCRKHEDGNFRMHAYVDVFRSGLLKR